MMQRSKSGVRYNNRKRKKFLCFEKQDVPSRGQDRRLLLEPGSPLCKPKNFIEIIETFDLKSLNVVFFRFKVLFLFFHCLKVVTNEK
jgi:hypothetical protein